MIQPGIETRSLGPLGEHSNRWANGPEKSIKDYSYRETLEKSELITFLEEWEVI